MAHSILPLTLLPTPLPFHSLLRRGRGVADASISLVKKELSRVLLAASRVEEVAAAARELQRRTSSPSTPFPPSSPSPPPLPRPVKAVVEGLHSRFLLEAFVQSAQAELDGLVRSNAQMLAALEQAARYLGLQATSPSTAPIRTPPVGLCLFRSIPFDPCLSLDTCRSFALVDQCLSFDTFRSVPFVKSHRSLPLFNTLDRPFRSTFTFARLSCISPSQKYATLLSPLAPLCLCPLYRYSTLTIAPNPLIHLSMARLPYPPSSHTRASTPPTSRRTRHNHQPTTSPSSP